MFDVGFSRRTGVRSSGGGGRGGAFGLQGRREAAQVLNSQLKIGLIGGLLSKVLDDFHVLSAQDHTIPPGDGLGHVDHRHT